MGKHKDEKIVYGVRINKNLVKELKMLAVKLDKRQNELLEEAIKLLLEKYKKENNRIS